MNKSLTIPDEVLRHNWYQKWKEFHLENRNVIRSIVQEIREAKKLGKSKVSVKTIIGGIRWDETKKIKGDGEYKINDAFTSIYGNIIKATFPELASMIETRKIRSKAN